MGRPGSLHFDIIEVYAYYDDDDKDEEEGGLLTTIIDTDAHTDPGEAPFSVPAAIVVGLAGIAAAAAGAAAAGAAAAGGSAAAAGATGGAVGPLEGGGESDPFESTYQLILYKDFGNTIRYDREAVYVYARMVEIDQTGTHLERPDLTQQISITSSSPVLNLGAPQPSGQYIAAPVAATSGDSATPPAEGVISFTFSGEGGIFQNNVTFQLAGEPRIEFEDNTIYLLATDQTGTELKFNIHDFANEVEFELTSDSTLFELAIEENGQNEHIIKATPTAEAQEKPLEKFIYDFPCSITAKNEQETVTEQFELYLCYEGIGTAYQNSPNNRTPEKPVLHTFSDTQAEKREEEAFQLPLTVMTWNKETGRLEPDETLSKNLDFAFTVEPDFKELDTDAAKEALDAARIIADTNLGISDGTRAAMQQTGAAGQSASGEPDHELKPSIFKLYASQSAEAPVESIDLVITVTTPEADLPNLELKAQLKPQNDYRAMLRWFLEYGEGTHIDKYINLGEVNTFFGALEFIENRVFSMSTVPFTPKSNENHYEDAKLDVSRSKSVVLLDESMPRRIGEFMNIQSLYHELIHAIEDRNGDIGVRSGGGNPERHSFHLQYLSDAVKALADLENNPASHIQQNIRTAITKFQEAFFHPDFGPPQTLEWFEARTQNHHFIFDQYSKFDIYCTNPAVPDERKREISRVVAQHYFPGNIRGRYRETGGFFKDAVWTFTWGDGYLRNLRVEHPGYDFTVRTPNRWLGGNQLAMEVTYDVVCRQTGKEDTLSVELDAGTFDPFNHSYPPVNKLNVKWNAAYRITGGLMDQPHNVTEAEKM